MVSDKQKADLIFLIADTNNYLSLPMAARIAERIINEGWQPPVLEDFDPEHNKVALLPEQEVEILDRIVHDLPAVEVFMANGVRIIDVASLHPQEVKELWTRIPDFDNYEMNLVNKDIRNRFTKRNLETTNESGNIYTEMHDKEGFPHYISVEHVYELMMNS